MSDYLKEEIEQVKKWDIEFDLIGKNRPAVFDKKIADCDIDKNVKTRLLHQLWCLSSGVNFDNPPSRKEDITFDHLRHFDVRTLTSTRYRNWGKKCVDELLRIVEENNAVFYDDHKKRNFIESLKPAETRSESVIEKQDDKQYRINQKLSNLYQQNSDFILTPIKDLTNQMSASAIVSLQHKAKHLDFILDVTQQSEDDLMKLGMDKNDVAIIDRELRQKGFQLDMLGIVTREVELEDIKKVEQLETERLKQKAAELSQRYNLNM